ncbi:GAF domain-containing sensor histidine kinase [Halobaculum rubrum]|uniref:GAF domain-containing sensor histidine kinase n=1 Tax=Halobaculum rubrum TaxID=2872158 RepID=UPI001CA3BD0F|nr:GAF domain-containing sensor histidine kinase [Halobaculum rubrum]QZX99641.1 GAF domain-containing sensor histidine kinase [Halobaculum rubrum]
MNGAAGTEHLPADERDDARDTARHVDLQALVIDASTTLLSANPDELHTKLTWTLRSVATGVDADYAGVYEIAGDGGRSSSGRDPETFDRRYAWHRDGIEPDDPPPADIEPLVRDALGRVGGSEAVRVAKAGTDAVADEGSTASGGTNSYGTLLAVPIVREYELWGTLVFAGRSDRERWRDHEVVLVRSLADMIAASLERVQRERDLAAQNDRLEEFASVVAHDLRNPLNVLTGSLDMARRTGDDEHFDRAKRSAERIDEIIDTVLGLSRAGQDIGETEMVRIGKIARTAWERVQTDDATLVVDAPGQYDADTQRLTDVFSNLFRNAIEHGGGDVEVTVAGLANGRNGFYVADDGPGMPDDMSDPFHQGHSGESDGTGLGLTIVRRVVEAHGWSVDVTDSEAGGARFDILVEG